MKNQYVGDIGDYGKYALLRTFAVAGIKVGVNWYLTEDDSSKDGKFTNYLYDEGMRCYCPEVFDGLKHIVLRDKKCVSDVRAGGVLPGASYYEDVLSPKGLPKERSDQREAWFDMSLKSLSDADLVFMDPDNGLLVSRSPSSLGAEKYVLPDEVEKTFRAGHNVVYYCHKGRRKRDAWKDYLNFMFTRIPEAKSAVLTYHKGTQRSFVFLIHEDDYEKYRTIIETFVRRWDKLFTEECI